MILSAEQGVTLRTAGMSQEQLTNKKSEGRLSNVVLSGFIDETRWGEVTWGGM